MARVERLIWILRLTRAAASCLSIALLLIGWEIVSHSGAVTPFMLPAIEAVGGRIIRDAGGGGPFINLGPTLYRSLLGFSIAAGGGGRLCRFFLRGALVRRVFHSRISVVC